MEIRWDNRSNRYWKEEGEDWLCLHKQADEAVSSVILMEDTHHYFKEVHVRVGEDPLDSHRLDGPGPFEIQLEGLGECVILARVYFFKYFKAPCQMGQVRAVCCGEITRADRNDPQRIMMQIGLDRPTRSASTLPLQSVEEVVRKVGRSRGMVMPELVRGGDPGAAPFMLRDEARTDTLVLLLKDQAPPFQVVAGQTMPVDKLKKSGADLCEIPAGRWSPVVPLNRPEWSIAIPAAKTDEQTVIFGPALILKPLISDLRVIAQPPRGVFAEWDWCGPSQWLQVKLCWDYYDEDGYADIPQQELFVSKAKYDRDGVFEFLNYSTTPGLDGWSVIVTATPVLLGKENTVFPELETTARL